MEQSIDQAIYEETEKRITEMQSQEYVFPAKMRYIDFVVILSSIGICSLLLVLCMMGVIL